MARIPKYAFRVLVTVRKHDVDGQRTDTGQLRTAVEQHNYETLPGAWAYRDIVLRRPKTTKVEIWAILDESTPGYSTGE